MTKNSEINLNLDLTDIITAFIIPKLNARGRIVHLSHALNQILEKHKYPGVINHLVAQILALTAMLGSSIKLQGRFSVQLRSSSVLELLVCDFYSPGKLRCYAKYKAEQLEQLPKNAELIKLLEGGNLTFSIDMHNSNSLYQAIIPLEGRDLAEIAENYYKKSEQIDTKIKLTSAVIKDKINNIDKWQAGGFLLQYLPNNSQTEHKDKNDNENWKEAKILAQTIEDEELLDVSKVNAAKLLFRLYHQYDIELFQPIKLTASCNCSKEKIASMLKNFDKAELEAMTKDNKIIVICQFCSQDYNFKPEEL